MSRVTAQRRWLPAHVNDLLDRSGIGDCLSPLYVYGERTDAVITNLDAVQVTVETLSTVPTYPEPKAAPGWLLAAIADARGTHDCPVCNAGRPLRPGVTCPLCAGWTTI